MGIPMPRDPSADGLSTACSPQPTDHLSTSSAWSREDKIENLLNLDQVSWQYSGQRSALGLSRPQRLSGNRNFSPRPAVFDIDRRAIVSSGLGAFLHPAQVDEPVDQPYPGDHHGQCHHEHDQVGPALVVLGTAGIARRTGFAHADALDLVSSHQRYQTYDPSAVFGFDVPARTRRKFGRNFKSTALAWFSRRAMIAAVNFTGCQQPSDKARPYVNPYVLSLVFLTQSNLFFCRFTQD